MKKEIKEFCQRHNITENQFYGKEKIIGYLDLGSVTTLPEGFGQNLTVGGDLYLGSVTTLPEGFGQNLTVGGYLDLGSVTTLPEGFGQNLTVGGYLYLRSVTTLPEGFGQNLTVGGDLYLRSVTTLPEGFGQNLTVGGDLYHKMGKKYIGAAIHEIPSIPQPELKWKDGKYTKIDGLFCEIVSAHVIASDITIIRAKKINKEEYFFIAQKERFSAHGETIEKAIDDLQFKIASDKLKNEPIQKDTLLTVKYYRLLTGACDFGVREFMKTNGLEFTVLNQGKQGEETKEINPIKACDLLPLLEKHNAYGLGRFKKLITF